MIRNGVAAVAVLLLGTACGSSDRVHDSFDSEGGNGGAESSSTSTSSTRASAGSSSHSAASSSSSSAGGAESGSGGAGGTMPSCPAPLGEMYTSSPTLGTPTADPPHQPDLNIKLRDWTATQAPLQLVDYAGDTDSKAPRLATLVDGQSMPALVEGDRVNGWDWSHNRPTGPIPDWPVTMSGLATAPGVTLRLPHGGYQIAPGLEARVLYLDEDSIAFKYTGEDNVISGYTIHVFGVCLEPALINLYASDDAAGRTQMPALRPNQAFGRARQDRVLVVVRDTGSFMDPRSRKDWW